MRQIHNKQKFLYLQGNFSTNFNKKPAQVRFEFLAHPARIPLALRACGALLTPRLRFAWLAYS